MKLQNKIIFVRADLWNTTPAIPKAVNAIVNKDISKIALEWKKSEKIKNSNISGLYIRSFSKKLGKSKFCRLFLIFNFMFWVFKQFVNIRPSFIHCVSIYTLIPTYFYKLFYKNIKIIYEIREPFALVITKNKLLQTFLWTIDKKLMNCVEFFILPNDFLFFYLKKNYDPKNLDEFDYIITTSSIICH